MGGAGEPGIESLESSGESGGEEACEAEARVLTWRREFIAIAFFLLLSTSSVRINDRLHETRPARRGYVSKFEGITGEGATDVVERGDEMLIEWFKRGVVGLRVDEPGC